MTRRGKKAPADRTLAVYPGTPYHRDTFAKYAAPYSASGIRFHAFTLVLLMLNLFLLIPVFGNPYQPVYAYLLMPPLIVMNLWALALIALPRRLQRNYVLFRGVFGVVATLSFTIVNQKLAYGMLGLQSPWYGIVSFAAYVVGFYFYAKRHIGKLKRPPKSWKEPQSSWKDREGSVSSILSASAGFGYLAANLSLGMATQQMVAVVLMSVYTLMTFVLFHFMMELHRYYWLTKTAASRV